MPLSPSLTEELGKRLRQSREELLAAVRARTGSAEGDPPQISPAAHQAQADDAPEAEMISHDQQHLADHESAQLHEIDAAIARLESGAIGMCVSCGCEIPEARLLATPTAQTCVACQERIEKEQARREGPGSTTM